ncbi:hypothetical protein GGX14DRAFT_595855 [Mycena pura]|uniref:F-box domain-containing protein n=1 Tax=Mycena pura TaxID=153505 RepID=A0AAD6Y393_9AGAR|nr:hypothetical protein GGX14DRAFT_595855 [Mycena pura]
MAESRLLTLPSELILACLAHLPFSDLTSCLKVGNRFLRDIILTSVLIRYRLELERYGVEETAALTSHLVISDRIQELRNREANWLNFTPRSRYTISVDFKTTSIYDLVSDVYLVGDTADPTTGLCKALKYIHTSGTETPQWNRIDIGKPIIDFGLALEEHDLLAAVTYTPQPGNPHMHSVDVLLLSFSAGSSHRLATHPTLHLQDVELDRGRPSITIEIVGRHLAISLMYWQDEDRDNDCLYLYDWQRGVLKIVRPPLSVNTTGLVFLAVDILLVPSAADGTLDVFRIPESGSDALVLYSFSLPLLQPDTPMSVFQCHAAPNPRTARHTARATFTAHPADALIFVSFDTGDGHFTTQQHTFVLHRASFLAAVRSLPETESSAVEWCAWGPACTCWLDPTERAARYITVACGQRVVSIAPDAWHHPAPIRVLDFNQVQVNWQRTQPPQDRVRIVERDEPLRSPASFAFDEPVVSRLPYIETVSKETFDYHAVVITDDSIIGVRFDGRTVQSLEVLRFG